MWVFVALLLAFVVMGPVTMTYWPGTDVQQEKSYLRGMSAIACGVLTALLVDLCSRRRVRRGLLSGLQVTGGVLVFLIAWWPRFHWLKPVRHALGVTDTDDLLLAIGTCLVIFGSVQRGQRGRAWTAPLRWVGRYSYELYMTHEFLVVAGTFLYLRLLRGPLLAWILAETLLCLPVAWAVAKYFSEPMNRRLRGAKVPTELR